MAFVLASALEPRQRRETLRVIEGTARGERFEQDDVSGALIEGTQGLGGAALSAGVAAAGLVWLSNHVLAVGTTALAALAVGLTGFFAALAVIYGIRAGWKSFIGGHPPRHADFWVAAACGLAMAGLVFGSLLTVHGPSLGQAPVKP